MSNLITFFFSLLILGLIAHWVLIFIKSTKYSQIEKARNYLDKIYGPFLDIIKSKIKPIIKMRNGKELDFSPGILLILLAILRKIAFYIF